MVRELHTAGYQLSNIKHLKKEHVEFLVKTWQEKGIANSTIKPRLSHLRYLCEAIDKPNLFSKSNEALNVENRSYVSDKSRAIHEIDVSKFEDPLIRYSIKLQQLFGLRREEALKFIVGYADKDTYILLKPSWTKGGIGRIIPIKTPEQKALLEEIKDNIGLSKSLIPEGKEFADQKYKYDKSVIDSEYNNLHGLRHAYAQRRYFELTNELTQGNGWRSHLDGGKERTALTKSERDIDRQVRLIISRELGHSRKQITYNYC